MSELKKNLDELARELNGRKTKIVKPMISEAKELINSTFDFGKETNQRLEELEE